MPTKKTTKQSTADSSGLDLSNLMSMLVAVEKGDFSKRMPDSPVGLEGKTAERASLESIDVCLITGYLKHEEICSMVISITPNLSRGDSNTETHISAITDFVIVLRYVELIGGIAVIKMRGSQHEKSIREFTIDEKGLTIGASPSLTGSRRKQVARHI
ncbi:MAG: hypothetical protein MJE63_25160 [Proteobacteria bacterium]|nr:hypothetical protein [Pseudomonadota bacterium]